MPDCSIPQSLQQLQLYIETNKFKGYDPYDTLLSWLPFHWLGKWGPVLAIQFQKRNFFNIRPLLGIKKEINPKAFGILLNTYSLMYIEDKNIIILEKMKYLFNWLKHNPSPGFTGMSWGYNFPWASPVKFLPSFMPSSVVTGFVCRGIFSYYKATGDIEAVKVLRQAKNFILNELPLYEDSSGQCISYTPVMKDICYNASLLAGEVLAINYNLNPEKELKEKCQSLVNFVISRQKEDGSWAYSEDILTGIERNQIDFHQGYIIESIHEIMKLFKVNDYKWDEALLKGLEFYRNEQFFENGQSLWRLPKEYPVDIHNQSQGIIIFSKFSHVNKDYLGFAEKIAEYTIKNMQSADGHFYYQKFSNYTNKISYMRWSQSWMFLALTTQVLYNK